MSEDIEQHIGTALLRDIHSTTGIEARVYRTSKAQIPSTISCTAEHPHPHPSPTHTTIQTKGHCAPEPYSTTEEPYSASYQGRTHSKSLYSEEGTLRLNKRLRPNASVVEPVFHLAESKLPDDGTREGGKG